MNESRAVVCAICPHRCSLRDGAVGVCGARGALEGHVVSLSYGRAIAVCLDPIEKKPLAHFHPGSLILSYGSFGCNLCCPFCQNGDIATLRSDSVLARDVRAISPKELVERANALKEQGNVGIAFTYNEPLIAPEFLIECAQLAHERGLLAVAVTNGYVEPKTRDAAIAHLDALNIDMKCFSEEGYRTLGAPGGLAVVQGSIAAAVRAGVHVEVTTLVVPGLSDDEALFARECAWIASVDCEIPLHITRFFPAHRMRDAQPTDLALMQRFYDLARRSLRHVHLGNV